MVRQRKPDGVYLRPEVRVQIWEDNAQAMLLSVQNLRRSNFSDITLNGGRVKVGVKPWALSRSTSLRSRSP